MLSHSHHNTKFAKLHTLKTTYPQTIHRLFRSGAARAVVFSLAIALTFLSVSWQKTTEQVVSGQATVTCPTIQVPALTHGFTTSDLLPNGDHFLLPQPFTFSIPTAAPGLTLFNVSPATFGGTITDVGGFAGTNPQAFSFSTPGTRFTALSCTDSVWDASFVVASNGATVGDTVTIFAQGPDGNPSINVITLTVEANGVRVTSINTWVFLFLNNRLGNAGRLSVGDFIPFVAGAGSAGTRTGLLTLAYQMRNDSPLNACLQLGVSINRGNGTGSTTMLITDVIVKRMETAGDRARAQTGLISGLTGGYPTGLVCPVVCPVCPPPPVKCDTFCWRSADYWLLHLKRQPLPKGSVYISGINFNIPISTKNVDAINIALGYCSSDLFSPLTPQERFNREWVAAQLNQLWAACGGSPNYYNAQWTNLSCYGFSFAPVTLSNGFVLSPNSMVKDLFMQAYLAAVQNRFVDFQALANILALFNGNDPLNACNLP
jgi:hypothetical protein